MKVKNKKLVALTTAALSLPGMIPKASQAQTIPENFTASYRFTEYKEDDQDGVVEGSPQRYDISIHQLSLVAPVSSQVSFNVDASTESMSGASPWLVASDADEKPVQVMSGATIEESRDDISFAANFYQEKARIGLGISRSTENDYDSTSANINTSVWFNGKNTTLDVGFSFSDDTITPTQKSGITRVTEEDKDSNSLALGLSQVINKTLLVGAGFSYASYDGFLSDPYKLAEVEGVRVFDSRPDSKDQFSLDFKLRKYLTKYSAAIHADYKYYDNNWGISSHTVNVGWYQNIQMWQFSTSVRWYDQSSANFYQNFYTAERADGYYSSDYRLSAYGALSYRLGLSKSYEFGTFKITYENYNSGKGTQSDGDLNPGLVDFQFITLGFDYKF
ncbi:MAG: hypothetical protein ACJAUP_003113 [Cellvibrionaceae bacterium]|jgi:hypothetical protein